MRETMIASCEGKLFTKKERVIAYTVFEKFTHNFIKTYIEKYSQDKMPKGEAACEKQSNDKYNIYNIGDYRVEGVLADYVRISPWERGD